MVDAEAREAELRNELRDAQRQAAEQLEARAQLETARARLDEVDYDVA